MGGTWAHTGHREGALGDSRVIEVTDSRGCRRPAWPRPPPHGHRAGPVPCGPSPASAGSPGDKGTWGHCHIPCLSPTLAICAPASAGGPGDTGDSPIPVWCPHLCLDVPSPCTHPGDPIPTEEQCPCPHSSVPTPISLSLQHHFSVPVPLFPSLCLLSLPPHPFFCDPHPWVTVSISRSLSPSPQLPVPPCPQPH